MKIWKFLFALRPVFVPALVFAVELMLWIGLSKEGFIGQASWPLLGLSCCILLALLITACAFFNPKDNESLLAATGSATPFLLSGVVAMLAYAVRSDFSFLDARWVMVTVVLSFIGQMMVSIWHLIMSLGSEDSSLGHSGNVDATAAVFYIATDSCDSDHHSPFD